MIKVSFKRMIKRVFKLLILTLLVVNVLFNYIEYHTAKKRVTFSNALSDSEFYDKMFTNNEEFILNVVNSNEYTSNVFKYDLFIAIGVLFLVFVYQLINKLEKKTD